MAKEKNRVCPVERAGHLDNRIRRWLQNPEKILAPYIREGMTVLDLGCGPGFFTLDMAEMVGETGHVIASDMQEGMLAKLKLKIENTALQERIRLHLCTENKIGLSGPVDFILVFYMVHEVPHINTFFHELFSFLNSNGKVLVVEPSFHVSKAKFEKTVQIARNAGFSAAKAPKVFFSRSVILEKHVIPLT